MEERSEKWSNNRNGLVWTEKRGPIKPVFKSLHWLPVKDHIDHNSRDSFTGVQLHQWHSSKTSPGGGYTLFTTTVSLIIFSVSPLYSSVDENYTNKKSKCSDDSHSSAILKKKVLRLLIANQLHKACCA